MQESLKQLSAWWQPDDFQNRVTKETEFGIVKIDLLPEPFCHLDTTGKIVTCNQRACELFGYDISDFERGLDIFALLDISERSRAKENLSVLMSGKEIGRIEYLARCKNGSTLPVIINSKLVFHGDTLVGICCIIFNIQDYKEAQERIEYLSFHDALTGLYNRAYFEEEMRRLNTIRKFPVGIIMMDVDNLKFINDTFGHDKGDELLKSLANILKGVFRQGDVVARIGGDEFAAIFPNGDEKAVDSICKRIKNACETHNRRSSQKLSVSMGYVIQYGQYQTVQEALKVADKHMYKDKLVSSETMKQYIIGSLRFMLAERDPHTVEDAEEMQALALQVGENIGLSDYRLNDLKLLALFHDIGKVGIPDAILFKPGKLSDLEWETMEKHCEIGYRIAKNVPVLVSIADEILSHHEWWNGHGYPRKLKAEEIPILSRIISIIDTYNMIQYNRPYKQAGSKKDALDAIKADAGIRFDPELVKTFLEVLKQNGEV